MNIHLYCDLSSSIGIGHYTRCKLIMDAFTKNGFQTKMYVGVENEQDYFFTTDVSIQAHRFGSTEEYSFSNDIAILDILHTKNRNTNQITRLIEHLRKKNNKIILIEGLDDDSCPSNLLDKLDILITPYISERANVKVKNHLFGKEYLLIDPSKIVKNKKITKIAKNILLTFGGSDPYDQSNRCLSQIQKDPRAAAYNFTVIIGPLMRRIQFDELKKHLSYLSIKIVKNAKNIVKYFENCDVCITNTGQTRYELAASGVPMIIYPFDMHGYKKSLFFEESGAAILNDSIECLNNDMVFKLLEDYPSRQIMSTRGKSNFFSPDALKNLVCGIIELCR